MHSRATSTGLTAYQGIISNVVAMQSFGAAFPDLYTNALLTVGIPAFK